MWGGLRFLVAGEEGDVGLEGVREDGGVFVRLSGRVGGRDMEGLREHRWRKVLCGWVRWMDT